MHRAPVPAPTQDRARRRRGLVWLPAAVLGAGLVLGIAVWAKWGLAVAFEAVRAYCF